MSQYFFMFISYNTAMITIILIILILIILVVMWSKTKTNVVQKKKIEKLIDMHDMPNEKPKMMSPKIDPNFIEAQFHQDYMDVSSAFNDLSPNQRQVFNVNNVPCEVTKGADIEKLGGIIKEFIKSLNDEITKNAPLIHTANSSWSEATPVHTEDSGWEKVQKSLGLPASIYNKPKLNTIVKLVQFSDVVKYETENEIKYECRIVIVKNKVHDKLVIKVSFVLPKGMKNDNVIIEEIYILGFLTEQGLGVDRVQLDDFYNFESLERNNMITGKTVAQEMMKKYDMRQQVMQEMIDGMDVDVQDKYVNSPSPAKYDSYQLTQTVFDDMFGEKKFD